MSDEGKSALDIPLRANGTPRVFWYLDGHVIYRHPDGTIEALGFQCRHSIEAVQ